MIGKNYVNSLPGLDINLIPLIITVHQFLLTATGWLLEHTEMTDLIIPNKFRLLLYLYSFSDNLYSNITLEGIIGDGYIGGKNINQALDIDDQFGWSVSL
ncbi:MAG: hypothetical protein MZU84_03675 [Sphingobacterium sp.]|nr:hypothetical protein [Sphingobacterium sp.]